MYSEACGRFSALKPWCGVRRLTRSWCSWSGPGDRGRSERSVAALRWWHGTSGKCTCPGLWLSHGYGTAGTGAWGKRGRHVKRDRCSLNNCFDTLHHSCSICHHLLGCKSNRISSLTCVTTCFTGCHCLMTVIRWDAYLPAFLTKPTSASTAWQMSQQKQSGCQL